MDKVKSFLHKHAHHQYSEHQPYPSAPATLAESFPNEQDCYRYRKQRGVNLGSWFVLERWITDIPYRFAVAPGQSDHDVARGSYGKQVLEKHWDQWITESDWEWIAERGINTVRIPIGFYHLCSVDPSVLDGTDFAGPGNVFEGAWSRITNAIATAHRYGIGVLIDLHAAPGKQNADAHSGTSSSNISFFTSAHMSHTTHILTSLLTHLITFTRTHSPPLPNLIGIELLNEPNPPSDHSALQKWYHSTISVLQTIDPSMPLYIGDSWRTDEYAGVLEQLAHQNPRALLALDHHLYRCFTQSDAATPAAAHAGALADPNAPTPATFARVAAKLAGAGAGLVVGEWSGALNPGSLHGVPDEHAAKRAFVDAQLALYERECAGSFWWTYKKQQGGDSGWAMRDAVERGVFPAWVGLRVGSGRVVQVDGAVEGRKVQAKDKALGEHAGWWSKYPGHYEHWRFEEGFLRGWDDAYLFFSSSPTTAGSIPEIGFKGAWAKRRATEHANAKGNSNLWEYEHGINQGINAARVDFVQAFC